jgi:hypothetical protein
MSGKVMQQFISNGGEIAIAEQLKPGAYLLNIEYNDGQREVVKILKTN